MSGTEQYLPHLGGSGSDIVTSATQAHINAQEIGNIEPGKVVRFSRYFDPYMGDWNTSSIGGGMVGTICGADTSRQDYFVVKLGDGTPVSVHKQNMAPFLYK